MDQEQLEYLAGGAMVIAGGVLMTTGVGGPAGMMLISAGADTIIQKATTGEVNWGQVAVVGAAGGIGFGAGSLVARGGGSAMRVAMTEGATEGLVSGGGSYLTGPGPHTPAGFVRSTTFGGATGALPFPGGAGGAGDDVLEAAGRNADNVAPSPTVYRAGDGDGYAANVLPGGRPDGQTVFAGHGSYRFGAGDVQVPEGTTVHVYAPEGTKITDSAGRAIETGGGASPYRSFGPGEMMPNYDLKTPDGLTIHEGSQTVGQRTPLSDLLRADMGDVHWAACTEYGS